MGQDQEELLKPSFHQYDFTHALNLTLGFPTCAVLTGWKDAADSVLADGKITFLILLGFSSPLEAAGNTLKPIPLMDFQPL